MGHTFEIWTWQNDDDGHLGYRQLWADADNEEVAFATFKHLKATGKYPCLKLEWR